MQEIEASTAVYLKVMDQQFDARGKAGILAVLGIVCLYAPKEMSFGVRKPMTLGKEFSGILHRPRALALVLLFLLTQATTNREMYERNYARLFVVNVVVAGLLIGLALTQHSNSLLLRRLNDDVKDLAARARGRQPPIVLAVEIGEDAIFICKHRFYSGFRCSGDRKSVV